MNSVAGINILYEKRLFTIKIPAPDKVTFRRRKQYEAIHNQAYTEPVKGMDPD